MTPSQILPDPDWLQSHKKVPSALLSLKHQPFLLSQSNVQVGRGVEVGVGDQLPDADTANDGPQTGFHWCRITECVPTQRCVSKPVGAGLELSEQLCQEQANACQPSRGQAND